MAVKMEACWAVQMAVKKEVSLAAVLEKSLEVDLGPTRAFDLVGRKNLQMAEELGVRWAVDFEKSLEGDLALVRGFDLADC
eukprot:14796678-Ditylum_brightwellii.AAC.2